MKKSLIPILLFSWLCLAGGAQTLPQEGRVFESKSYDLNGDGKNEKIVLVAYKVHLEEESFWGRLKVLDSAGKVLWAAPAASDTGEAFAFGMWPFGASGLHWLGDIDGDGKAELLSPAPVSDVRPPTYRRFRWTGKAFQVLSPKMLLGSPSGSGHFFWKDPLDWDGVQPLTWVTSLSGDPESKLAEIVSYRKDGSIWWGQASLKSDNDGFKVLKWNKPLAPPN